jgi:UrcA family protein
VNKNNSSLPIVAIALLLPVPADASTHRAPVGMDEVPTTRVFVGDLDLGTANGQQIAHRRLRSAVAQVCADVKDYPLHPAHVRCKQESIKRATVALDALAKARGASTELVSRPHEVAVSPS